MVTAKVLGAVAVLAVLSTACTGPPSIEPDHMKPASPTNVRVLTMSWPEPRRYSEDWSLQLIWDAHHRACPQDGADFSVNAFEQSPERSPRQVLVTFRCDNGTVTPVKVILRSQEPN